MYTFLSAATNGVTWMESLSAGVWHAGFVAKSERGSPETGSVSVVSAKASQRHSAVRGEGSSELVRCAWVEVQHVSGRSFSWPGFGFSTPRH